MDRPRWWGAQSHRQVGAAWLQLRWCSGRVHVDGPFKELQAAKAVFRRLRTALVPRPWALAHPRRTARGLVTGAGSTVRRQAAWHIATDSHAHLHIDRRLLLKLAPPCSPFTFYHDPNPRQRLGPTWHDL